MKVIGLKPDNFEPKPVVDIHNLYAAKGVQPVQAADLSNLKTEQQQAYDSSKHLLDFMNKLRQKKKSESNIPLINKGRSAYMALINAKATLSQIGAKLDKRL